MGVSGVFNGDQVAGGAAFKTEFGDCLGGVVQQAGFEIGTGIYINPVPPEICAEQLNKVKLK